MIARRLRRDRAIVGELSSGGLLLGSAAVDTIPPRLMGNSLTTMTFWTKGFIQTFEVPDYVRERDVEVFDSVMNAAGRRLLAPFR